MKQISILVTYHSLIAAIGNSRYMFAKVNEFLQQKGQNPLFNLSLVGISKQMKLSKGQYTIRTDALLGESKQSDLIIIPPTGGQMNACLAENRDYLPWIKRQYERGAEVASLCVGAFLLAETGLLNGHKCSTHWKTANEFRHRFPEVQLVDEKIITDHNGLYTSGGANSYWNLLVYLVEKYADREMALRTSKYFEVDMWRDNQGTFTIFEGYRFHNDEPVLKAQTYIENNYREDVTVQQLAEISHLSRRTFQRRFKKATHYSVGKYIQRVRVEAAKKILECSRNTINEVKHQAGYKDSTAFRKVFKKFSGMTPIEYREKYNKRGPGQ